MKEIHLGQILAEHRRRSGITQDELAEFLGVSKAAVSKWETETTYPDILLLPRLASYFDISIDELMGYEPQMDAEGIREMYRKLTEEFAACPFMQVREHCREYVRKYYSCYPLLFQIASLLINHSMLAGDRKTIEQTMEEAAELCRRVKAQTDDPNLGRNALHLEAYCLLVLKRPEEVLEILEPEPPVAGAPEPLLASAWKMTGNLKEAKKILQAAIYKNIITLLNLLPSYMELCTEDPGKFEESCRRLQMLTEAFQADDLHPGILLSCYITMAQGWMSLGEKEKALTVLEKYTELAVGDIYPIKLKGDDYFDLLEEWFERSLSLGAYPPRDESVIRHSMTQAVTENPAFHDLAEEPHFRDMVQRLKKNEDCV
ncbi:MAG TPA: helix-turn-helix domain-containing protein [Candidatus Mediterraneibacter avicola]|nr:helix-turn-helix domain-containing protein [Candidatus Mediterraneibacter avicola]